MHKEQIFSMWFNPNKNSPRHIIIKLSKIKDERILKAARGKKAITFKGIPIRLTVYFSAGTLQASKECSDISAGGGGDCQSRMSSKSVLQK